MNNIKDQIKNSISVSIYFEKNNYIEPIICNDITLEKLILDYPNELKGINTKIDCGFYHLDNRILTINFNHFILSVLSPNNYISDSYIPRSSLNMINKITISFYGYINGPNDVDSYFLYSFNKKDTNTGELINSIVGKGH